MSPYYTYTMFVSQMFHPTVYIYLNILYTDAYSESAEATRQTAIEDKDGNAATQPLNKKKGKEFKIQEYTINLLVPCPPHHVLFCL